VHHVEVDAFQPEGRVIQRLRRGDHADRRQQMEVVRCPLVAEVAMRRKCLNGIEAE
jgi:hypothetical protein